MFRWVMVLVFSVVLVGCSGVPVVEPVVPSVDPMFDLGSLDVVTGDLIVVLDEGVVGAAGVGLSVASAAGGVVVDSFDSLGMLVVRAGDGLSVASVFDGLLADPRVLSVEPNRGVVLWSGVDWGLDRLNQRKLPLDGRVLSDPNGGVGVRVYVVDSGVKADHPSLRGRVLEGVDVTYDAGANGFGDCGEGHGTAVASKVAGVDFGVAAGATIVPVKAFMCGITNLLTTILSAMDWVLADATAWGGPSVANLSFGSSYSPALNAAAERLVAGGVLPVVAAGNSDKDACGFSPAGALNALTVASSNNVDRFSWFSAFGPCVSVVAPGEDVLVGSWSGSGWGSKKVFGTSFSAPLVSGLAARYWGEFRDAGVFEVGLHVLEVASQDTVGDTMRGLERSPRNLAFAPVSLVRAGDGIPGDFKCPFCIESRVGNSWPDAGLTIQVFPFDVPAGRAAEVRFSSFDPGNSDLRFRDVSLFIEERRGRLWWLSSAQMVGDGSAVVVPAKARDASYRLIIRPTVRASGVLMIKDVTHGR